MSLHLYLLRHGETALSRGDVFCGSGLDPELTESGLQMAQAFADTYASKSWAAIYTSALQRTIATAKPLCDALKIEPGIRAGMNEIGYGKWEGLTKATVDRDYHDDYKNWLADPAWHAPTGGELAVTVARRAGEVLEELRQRHPTGNVLIVSHKATIRILISSLLGIDLARFRYRLGCPVGSLSVVEFSTEGVMLHSLADRSHLNEQLRALPGT